MAVIEVSAFLDYLDKMAANAERDAQEADRGGDSDVAEFLKGKAAAYSDMVRKLKEG